VINLDAQRLRLSRSATQSPLRHHLRVYSGISSVISSVLSPFPFRLILQYFPVLSLSPFHIFLLSCSLFLPTCNITIVPFVSVPLVILSHMDYVFYLFLIVSPQFRTLLQCSVFKIVNMYTTNPVLKLTLLAHSSRPFCSTTSSLGHGFAKGPTSTVESKPVCLVYSDILSNLQLPRGWYSSANSKSSWSASPVHVWTSPLLLPSDMLNVTVFRNYNLANTMTSVIIEPTVTETVLEDVPIDDSALQSGRRRSGRTLDLGSPHVSSGAPDTPTVQVTAAPTLGGTLCGTFQRNTLPRTQAPAFDGIYTGFSGTSSGFIPATSSPLEQWNCDFRFREPGETRRGSDPLISRGMGVLFGYL
jgi:hypothetical protein